MDLATASGVLRLLADPTRVRLLALLENEELTVAELAAVLHLAQPRVSTHLAKLKEAELVRDRRAGVSAYYRANNEGDEHQHALLRSLRESIDDALLREDAARLPGVLAQRAREQGWADTVAGDMERHYSPGRTWETVARSLLQLLATGDVLDIASGDGVTAELLAPHAHSIVCVDSSERVVEAAAKRLKPFTNVQVLQGDMHALELGDQRFDLVLMLHALTYAEDPAGAIAEAARMLRPGGRLLAATLGRHDHRAAVEPFDHRNLGFSSDQLEGFARAAGLEVLNCSRLSRERKAPHFEVISLLARKPS
ncbi:ArsR family transcriptional regulator [Rhodanobacter sp. Root480]|uniref:ArsR/SmtB family transcription factor n=1 Tax=Rhodanobacter ginsenosidimutans TaxID=490571 RepID=A0ABW0JV25_9GAMM|nr:MULTISPECIES: metalloregulator ArsR/SmtB family transcription factor [unclassified Rhodanobacter]KQY00664.1 ArsR family transcriptional regulator [Rhodanobacter sp. Root480]KRA36287.1 ArsR family transcriptional regulator [Rhodanobacter sp. Root627]